MNAITGDVESKIRDLEKFKKEYEVQQKDIESRLQELELSRNERSKRTGLRAYFRNEATPISPPPKK